MAKTIKKTKQQIWEETKGAIIMSLTATESLIKKDKIDEVAAELEKQLGSILKPGATSMPKEDGKGNIYCSYFEAYLPAKEFNKKKSKKGELIYKSRSVAGEQISRKLRALENAVNSYIARGLGNSSITPDEVNDMLIKLSAAKDSKEYKKADDVPALKDITGEATA